MWNKFTQGEVYMDWFGHIDYEIENDEFHFLYHFRFISVASVSVKYHFDSK